MAEFIPRDLGSPLHLDDPETGAEQLAEFQGFACEVPSDAGMVDAVNNPPLVPTANSVRAARMFRPELVLGLSGGLGLPTPDFLAASAGATFERRGLHNVDLIVPGLGANPIDMWSFESRIDNDIDVNIETWPGPTIRVREGQLVHSILGTSGGPHTIHHHGIEPTAMNDGVGHLTFEVEDGYTYQWRAAEAGTYFYHCHRNTTLHFEMGMYGMLIIDPDVEGAPFSDGASGVTLLRNQPVAYQAEAIWVADDIDTRWHNYRDLPGGEGANGLPLISHVASGIQECDNDGRSGFISINDLDNPRLHEFRPNVFVVSGQAAPFADDGQNVIPAAGVAVTPGGQVLVRALNASYCTTVWKFPTSLQGTVTAVDGRTLGRSDTGFGSYSEPYSLASIDHEFSLVTAQRWDVLVETGGAAAGDHLVEIEFRHWITHELLRRVQVPITVAQVG